DAVAAERVAVAGPRVAAGAREDRHHVLAEADGGLLRVERNGDGQRGGLAGGLDGDGRLAGRDWLDPAVGVDGGDLRVGAAEAGGGGQVEGHAGRQVAADEDGVRVARIGQGDGGGFA